MKVYCVPGIPNNISWRQWLSTGTLLARTVTMTFGDTARLVQLLATAATNLVQNRYSQSLLHNKGNAMNWVFIHGLYIRVLCWLVCGQAQCITLF